MNEESEEGKDEWSLEENLELEEEGEEEYLQTPETRPSSEAGASGDLPLWLSIIGIAIAPLLVLSFFMAKKQIDATREMGYAPRPKLYIALLVSLLGLGLYLVLIALYLVNQALSSF